MAKQLQLNTSIKHHFYVSLFISLWLVIFLVVIAPFDVADLPFLIRLQILPLYGIISLISYMSLIPVQNWVYKTFKKWNISHEVMFFIVFHLITLIGCFIYYKSEIINGTFSFSAFVLQIFYPIFILLFILIFIARWYVNNKMLLDKPKKIIITGDNKQDILNINQSNLVCVNSADNYVEIHYLKQEQLQKKLLRSTLKKIEQQIPSLVRVHRSYLINPIHFNDWKDNKTIRLTQIEVPISSNYKDVILELKNSPQKP